MLSAMKSRRGNTVLEFTLVGIPLIFVLISIFEISRGMWIYHTLAYAIKQGTRYAAVHGQNCSVAPNACTKTIGDIAGVIQNNGVGLLPAQLTLNFCAPPGGSAPSCTSGNAQASCLLKNCVSNATVWPPDGANRVGLDDIEITGSYPFASAIAMVWPGAHSTNVFPTFNLPASAREKVEF